MFNQILGSEEKRVGKWAAAALLLLSIFLLVKTVGELKRIPSIGEEIYPQSTIMVSGEGESFAIPDVASFAFSVIETGKTVANAQEKVNVKINEALNALKNASIEDRDIQTVNYSFNPKYEWSQVACVAFPCPSGRNILVGYEANQTIRVKVRALDKAGDLVTQIGAIGASNVSGVEFAVDDRERYVAEAREQAINKAKEKAKTLAKQLGVRLGDIIYYNEGGNYPVPFMAEGLGGGDLRAALPSSAKLPAGEARIVSQVTLTYEIK